MKIANPTLQEEEEFAKWVSERPKIIQEMIKKHPPGYLYKLKNTEYRVEIYSYSEQGTVTVYVSGKYNFIIHERLVFDINPEDLEECNLPTPDEKVGTMNLTTEELKALAAFIRKHNI